MAQLLDSVVDGTLEVTGDVTLDGDVDVAGRLESLFSDKRVDLGDTGTAVTIDASTGGVFTATLTGNCTFTLTGANPAANTTTCFALVLTNNATANRTVSFTGGAIHYPAGAVTRTTTANRTDVWFFFTIDGGTTWLVSIPQKDMRAS